MTVQPQLQLCRVLARPRARVPSRPRHLPSHLPPAGPGDWMDGGDISLSPPPRFALGIVDRSPVSSLGYHHAQQHAPTTGAHKRPQPVLACTLPCGSERSCLTALPVWNSLLPSHTLQLRLGGHGPARVLPPPNRPAGLPAC